MMQRETVHALDLVPCTFFCALLKRREASQMFLEFVVYFFSEFDLQLSKKSPLLFLRAGGEASSARLGLTLTRFESEEELGCGDIL